MGVKTSWSHQKVEGTLKLADKAVTCTENLRNPQLSKLFAIALQIKEIKENLLLQHCKCLVINHYLIFMAQNEDWWLRHAADHLHWSPKNPIWSSMERNSFLMASQTSNFLFKIWLDEIFWTCACKATACLNMYGAAGHCSSDRKHKEHWQQPERGGAGTAPRAKLHQDKSLTQ